MHWKKILLPILCAGLLATAAQAEPSVKLKGNFFEIKEALTPEIITAIKNDEGKVKDKELLSFVLDKAKDADLAKLCELYPTMDSLTVTGAGITDLSPLAKLKQLRGFKAKDVKAKDFSPLSGQKSMMLLEIDASEMGPDLTWMRGMDKLTSLRVRAGKGLTSFEGLPSLPKMSFVEITGAAPADLAPLVAALPSLTRLSLQNCTLPDLTPLGKLANLADLSLYGASLKDFGPLAACPKLKELTYYATKGADYASLGLLTQVEVFSGGLSDLKDIAWLPKLPNLKDLRLFAEPIEDYAPLAQSKLEKLMIWSMRKPVNMEPVGKIGTLRELKLWSVEEATGSKALGGLTNLEKLEISTWNKKGGEAFDLAFAAKAPKLKSVEIKEAALANFDALGQCPALTSVRLDKVTGVTSLAALKKLPNLTSLTVAKDAFPEAELQGFDPKVKVNLR